MSGLDAADRALVVELLARYAERIDDGDFAGVGELFADAVIEDGHGDVVATGTEEVTRLYRSTTRLHPDGTPRTVHLVTNVVVDPVDPTAADLSAADLSAADPAAADPAAADPAAADPAAADPPADLSAVSEVEVRSRYLVLQQTDSFALAPIAAGRYRDRVRKVDRTWRFVRRRMEPTHWGDVGEHLRFDPRDL